MGKYVENNLNVNETLVRKAKISMASIVPHIFLVLVFVGIITIWKPVIRKFTSELAFTNKRIIGKLGLIKTEAMNSPLTAIQNVKVKSGLFGKIFRYGSIGITTASGTYVFDYIKHPDEFKNALLNQIEEYKKVEMEENAIRIAQAMKNTQF